MFKVEEFQDTPVLVGIISKLEKFLEKNNKYILQREGREKIQV